MFYYAILALSARKSARGLLHMNTHKNADSYILEAIGVLDEQSTKAQLAAVAATEEFATVQQRSAARIQLDIADAEWEVLRQYIDAQIAKDLAGMHLLMPVDQILMHENHENWRAFQSTIPTIKDLHTHLRTALADDDQQ
jgi:hypothetical protein